jgi:hypothetical protein
MALVVKDRVKETTTTTGTGTLTLAGATVGFQSFSVIGNGNTTYYTITDGTNWEVGIGTYTSSGTTLARNTILESSNGGAAVNWGAGSKDVFVTYPAERSVTGSASALALPDPGTSGNLLTSNGSAWTSAAPPTGGVNVQVFTSSSTFTIPTGVTKVKVTVVGGGGGGGGASSSGCNSGFGGGGAAGSTAFKWLTSLTPGNTIGVTVGAGGTASTGAGGAGGSSSIQSGTQSITTVTALGGNGGAAGTGGGNVLGGLGQTPTNGDINITGDDGSNGRFSAPSQFGIGGLNAAFSSGNRQTTDAAGVAGNVYGNGGNGAHTSSVTLAGGAGGAGIVVFEW